MKHIQITLSNSASGRLLNAVCLALPDVPEYLIRQAFRKRDVKQNGRRAGYDDVCKPGAAVELWVQEHHEEPIPVLFSDERVVIINKPAGLGCEADTHGQATAAQRLQKQLGGEMPILCHRLDYYTEGVLVLARDENTAALLQDAFRNHRVHKQYECLVRGTPSARHAMLNAYLRKDAERALVRVYRDAVPGAVNIQTEYDVLEAGDVCRLLVTLHTGRTHQIRAHLAFIGHPLLGDDKYGDRAFNKAHHAEQPKLCAVHLQFDLQGELAYLNQLDLHVQPHF